MDGPTVVALIAASAALIGSFGGVVVGDVLAARREARQLHRQRTDQLIELRHGSYEELLKASVLAYLSLYVDERRRQRQLVPEDSNAIAGPNQELLKLRHAVRSVEYLGAPPEVVATAKELRKVAYEALSEVRSGKGDLDKVRQVREMSERLPALLGQDLRKVLT